MSELKQLEMQKDDEMEIDLGEIFHLLMNKLWIIVLCFIIGATLAFGGTKLLITPKYSASSMIYILTKTTSVTSLADIQMGTQLTADFEILATSRPVLEEVIEKLKSFNREKSIKRAESREKMLDKIEVIEKPSEVRTDMKLSLTPRILSGNDVLTVEHLSKSFDTHKLFTDVNFEIKRGEHVAIIGDNGSGKTTLLKILNGLVPADQGTFRLGSNVEIGYYDQEHHVLHSEKTLFEEISDDYPYLNNTQIRNVLAAFLFTGEDVFKRISDLSGGERGRVSLAKLVLSNANFLILDEPTNHLDIMSKEILENALNGYEGTILYVSHDRYFINRTAHRILDLTEGQFVNYVGNYDYYLEKHDTVMAATLTSAPQSANADNADAAKVAESEVKLDWKAQKEEQARLRKKENDLKKCEEKIAELEARISEIDTEMSDPAIGTQVAKLQELSKEQAACQEQLEKLYEQWEELAE